MLQWTGPTYGPIQQQRPIRCSPTPIRPSDQRRPRLILPGPLLLDGWTCPLLLRAVRRVVHVDERPPTALVSTAAWESHGRFLHKKNKIARHKQHCARSSDLRFPVSVSNDFIPCFFSCFYLVPEHNLRFAHHINNFFSVYLNVRV